ncbi:MAG: hypothetical protein V2I24_05760, partial [Halieaceae bacterium]|nr:hypothetical protein [Halieaceae bacterium]
LGAALRVWRPVLRARLARWRASEAYAFRRLRRTLKGRSREEIYRSLQRWLERLEARLGPRAFAAEYGDGALRAEIDALSERAFAGGQAEVDLRVLDAGLANARRRFLRQEPARGEAGLAPLNP